MVVFTTEGFFQVAIESWPQWIYIVGFIYIDIDR